MKKLFIIITIPFIFLSCKKDNSEKLSDHTLKFDITCTECTVTITGGERSEYRASERVKGSKSIVANMSDLIPFTGSIKSEVYTQDLKILTTEKKGSVNQVRTLIDEDNVEASFAFMFDNDFLYQ